MTIILIPMMYNDLLASKHYLTLTRKLVWFEFRPLDLATVLTIDSILVLNGICLFS